MPITTVRFLHPGALMGTPLAHVLAACLPHLKLLTFFQGRSEVIISRAESCGLTDVPFAHFVASRTLYYQFYPPVGLSGWPQKIIVHVKQDKKPIFVDANSISPKIAGYIHLYSGPIESPLLMGTSSASQRPKTFHPSPSFICSPRQNGKT